MGSGCKVCTRVWGDPRGQGADPIHACHMPGTVPGAPLMESDERLRQPCRVEVAVSAQLRYSARFSNLSEVTQLTKSIPGFQTQVRLAPKLGPWPPCMGKGPGVGMEEEWEGRRELRAPALGECGGPDGSGSDWLGPHGDS